MSRDKIAVMIKEATGWPYTMALRFRREQEEVARASGGNVAEVLVIMAERHQRGEPPVTWIPPQEVE